MRLAIVAVRIEAHGLMEVTFMSVENMLSRYSGEAKHLMTGYTTVISEIGPTTTNFLLTLYPRLPL